MCCVVLGAQGCLLLCDGCTYILHMHKEDDAIKGRLDGGDHGSLVVVGGHLRQRVSIPGGLRSG